MRLPQSQIGFGGLEYLETKFKILNFSKFIVPLFTLPHTITESPISSLSTMCLKFLVGSKAAQFTVFLNLSCTSKKRCPPLITIGFEVIATSIITLSPSSISEIFLGIR